MDNSNRYKELYLFQNKVLSLINRLQTPFYLTGGTALSRYYLFHRYSDDIDLFVNSDNRFKEYVELIEMDIRASAYRYEVATRANDFVRMNLFNEDSSVLLKVDLVNDIEYHFSGLELSDILGRVDNIRNILSNKVSAIPRLEIKDFVDILYICKKIEFSWKEVIEDAEKKDAWVNPLDLSRYFSTTDISLLKRINWIDNPDFDDIVHGFDQIANDILKGSINSLYHATSNHELFSP